MYMTSVQSRAKPFFCETSSQLFTQLLLGGVLLSGPKTQPEEGMTNPNLQNPNPKNLQRFHPTTPPLLGICRFGFSLHRWIFKSLDGKEGGQNTCSAPGFAEGDRVLLPNVWYKWRVHQSSYLGLSKKKGVWRFHFWRFCWDSCHLRCSKKQGCLTWWNTYMNSTFCSTSTRSPSKIWSSSIHFFKPVSQLKPTPSTSLQFRWAYRNFLGIFLIFGTWNNDTELLKFSSFLGVPGGFGGRKLGDRGGVSQVILLMPPSSKQAIYSKPSEGWLPWKARENWRNS